MDLWANESFLKRRRVVLEIPANCLDEELKQIGGETLDDLANVQQVDSWYETEDVDNFEVLDDISIEDEVAEHIESDLVFVRCENGLVLLEAPNSLQ